MDRTYSVDDLPERYRSIFYPMKTFNKMQSKIFNDVINSCKNLVVSAPTGSGKTILFELAIVELLISLEQQNIPEHKVKIVYVAPTKALCNEIFVSWRRKFEASWGLSVGLITGDSTRGSNLDDLNNFHIVVTTPEKWDAVTRTWTDHIEVAKSIKLFLIDEVHLVGDPNRGATLEAIVSRMKSFETEHSQSGLCQANDTRRLRMVAASASLPNIKDVGRWISAPTYLTTVFSIGEGLRSVQLERRVYGYTDDPNSFKFEAKLNRELANIVHQLIFREAPGKSILIFCQSRQKIDSALMALTEKLPSYQKHELYVREKLSTKIKEESLKKAVLNGFGFHHAGLTHEDRECIETAYRLGIIRILLSTSTLAMGVNLPAHTVIIKSTTTYVNGATVELPQSMILQMIGRAGRQQYCSSGRVIIMTEESKRQYYEDFVSGTEELESHLSAKLTEHLNAEIVLGTINDTDETLMSWLRTTFLYARTLARSGQPVDENNIQNDVIDDKLKVELGLNGIRLLQNSGVISFEPTSGGGISISSNPIGRVMSTHFLSLATIDIFHRFKGNESIENTLNALIHCSEFDEIYLRRTDKTTLNTISSNPSMRYRIIGSNNGKIGTKNEKISCLLQAILGEIELKNSALEMDTNKILPTAGRLSKGLVEYFHTLPLHDAKLTAVLSATILAKSFRAQLWENSRNVFKQLNVSKEDSHRLMRHNINTIDSLLKSNPYEIESLLEKSHPFGRNLIESAAKLPHYDVQIKMLANQTAQLCVEQTNKKHETDESGNVSLLVGDQSNNLLLCKSLPSSLNMQRFFEEQFPYESSSNEIVVHVIHDHLIGVDVTHRTKILKVESLRDATTTKTNEADAKRRSIQQKKSRFPPMQGQSDISSYFPKVKNLPTEPRTTTVTENLGPGRSPQIEFPSQSNLSVDLFSEKSMPLYDNGYITSTQSTAQSLPPYAKHNSVPNDTLNFGANEASPLYKTALRQKIDKQLAAKNTMHGFVTARALFNKESPESSSINPPNETPKSNGNEVWDWESDDGFVWPESPKIKAYPNEIPETKKRNRLYDFAYPISQLFSQPETQFDADDRKMRTENIVSKSRHICFDDINIDDSALRILKNQHNGSEQNNNVNDFDDDSDDEEYVQNEAIIHLNPIQSDFMSVNADEQIEENLLVEQAEESLNGREFVEFEDSTRMEDKPSPRIIQNPTVSSTSNTNSPIKNFIDNFQYVANEQTQPTALGSQDLQKVHLPPYNSPHMERKKPKFAPRLSIHELVANGSKERGRECPEMEGSPEDVPLKQKPKRNQILAHGRRQPEIEIDESEEIMKRCQERLETDPNYTKKDYDKDYIRYVILKVKVKKEQPNKSFEKPNFVDENSSQDSDFSTWFSNEWIDGHDCYY